MSSSVSKSTVSPTCASAEDMVRFSLSLTGVSSSSTNPFFDVKSVCVDCAWTGAGCCVVEAAGVWDATLLAASALDSDRKASHKHRGTFMSDPPATKKFRMLGNPGGTAIILSAGTMFNPNLFRLSNKKKERERAPQKLATDHRPLTTASVLRHLRIHALRPGSYPAREIVHLGETRLLQERDCFRAAPAHLAMHNDFAARIQFMHATRQVVQRNQMSADVADLVF